MFSARFCVLKLPVGAEPPVSTVNACPAGNEKLPSVVTVSVPPSVVAPVTLN